MMPENESWSEETPEYFFARLTDHVERHEVVEHHDRRHDHVREEVLLLVHQLGAHGGGGALDEQIALVAGLVSVLGDVHGKIPGQKFG